MNCRIDALCHCGGMLVLVGIVRHLQQPAPSAAEDAESDMDYDTDNVFTDSGAAARKVPATSVPFIPANRVPCKQNTTSAPSAIVSNANLRRIPLAVKFIFGIGLKNTLARFWILRRLCAPFAMQA